MRVLAERRFFHCSRYFHEQMFQALRDIKTAASKHGIPMSHVGFRWCVHHSQLNMPISGKGNDGTSELSSTYNNSSR